MKSTSSVCCAPAIRQSSPTGTQILRGVSCCSRTDGRITKPTTAGSTPLAASARICLTSATAAAAEPETEVEMLACLAQLQKLVPTGGSCHLKRSGHAADNDDEQQQQLSQVQLLQHVIDYIIDLENTLNFRPDDDAEAFQATAAGASTVVDVIPAQCVVTRNRMSSYDETAMTSDDDDDDVDDDVNADSYRQSSDSRLATPSSGEHPPTMNRGDTVTLRSW